MTNTPNVAISVEAESQADVQRDVPDASFIPPLAHPQPRIHLAWLIVPCLAADGLMVPVFSSLLGPKPPGDFLAAFVSGVAGCVLAQGCLLAAWVAWGDGPFLRRLAAHWIIAPCLYVLWLVGMLLALGSCSPRSSWPPLSRWPG